MNLTNFAPKIALNGIIFKTYKCKNFPGGACPQTPLVLYPSLSLTTFTFALTPLIVCKCVWIFKVLTLLHVCQLTVT